MGGARPGRGGGYLDKFCHFRPECFDCLPFKIVSYELFRCGKMISEAVRIFYVLIIIKNGFVPPEANQGELGNVVIIIKIDFCRRRLTKGN